MPDAARKLPLISREYGFAITVCPYSKNQYRLKKGGNRMGLSLMDVIVAVWFMGMLNIIATGVLGCIILKARNKWG